MDIRSYIKNGEYLPFFIYMFFGIKLFIYSLFSEVGLILLRYLRDNIFFFVIISSANIRSVILQNYCAGNAAGITQVTQQFTQVTQQYCTGNTEVSHR